MNDVWHVGLYSCTADPGQCLDCMLCPCCELSRQYSALNGQSETYHMLTLLLSPVGFSCFFLYARRKLLSKYHIDESMLLSVFTVLCCGACSVCQVHRELEWHSVSPGTTIPCLRSDTVSPYHRMK